MSNIHFIGGEKGGVGKSLLARVLAQYMIDKQLPFLGFDTEAKPSFTAGDAVTLNVRSTVSDGDHEYRINVGPT